MLVKRAFFFVNDPQSVIHIYDLTGSVVESRGVSGDEMKAGETLNFTNNFQTDSANYVNYPIGDFIEICPSKFCNTNKIYIF